MVIRLIRPAPEWGPAARHASWNGRPAMAILGPMVAGATQSGRARAERVLGLQEPGMWPLLDVVEHEGRSVWLYPAHPGISLGPLVGREDLPLRAAIEIIACVAALLQSLREQGGPAHPGPMPEDVLIDDDGAVHLCGFVGPTLPDPSRRAPGLSTPEADQVYRLGILAAELLTGSPLVAASSASAHGSALRRVMVRAVARPGPPMPGRFRDWLLAALAFEAERRPPLSRAKPTLSHLAATLPGLSLAEWCARPMHAFVAAPILRHPERHPDPTEEPVETDNDPEMRTISDGDFPDDDITAVSTGSTPGSTRRVELGSIPVTVGPPAEVARLRPTLPPELFDDPGPVSAPPPSSPQSNGPSPRVLAGIGLVLLAIAVALLVYLL